MTESKTDVVPSRPMPESEATVIIDESLLLELRRQSQHPPPPEDPAYRSEQPTLKLPRAPRAP